VTTAGFSQFAKQINGYETVVTRVYAEIVNNGFRNNRLLATKLDRPIVLVNHILDASEGRGLIEQTKTVGGGRHVHYVSPEVKRLIENN
jgi:hypothetical protein